jgi:two-component system LytT family sensor kinase
MRQVKKRYQFFSVCSVVFAVNILFAAMELTVLVILDSEESKKALREWASSIMLLKKFIAIACQSLFYYYALNHYNTLMVKKRSAIHYLRYSGWLLLIGFGYFVVMNHVFERKLMMAGKTTPTGLLVFSFAITTICYTAAALLIAYLNNLRDEKKHRKVLEAQKMQLEVDKSQANFKFLKSQINPHFLHNTLNFLYAKSLPYSAELSEGILTLSDIMRYALSEATGSDDKAPLKDEIEHVRNVIKINQLRFSNNLHVHFEVNGVVNGIEIIPFLLITVVENAFKHGDLQKLEHPIEIKLDVEHGRLYFYCRNRKKTGPKEISTGLGLDNIRNRLDFAYGKGYKLSIRDEAEFYTTELTIEKL